MTADGWDGERSRVRRFPGLEAEVQQEKEGGNGKEGDWVRGDFRGEAHGRSRSVRLGEGWVPRGGAGRAPQYEGTRLALALGRRVMLSPSSVDG